MSAPRRIDEVILEDVPESGEVVLLHPERGKVLALNAAGAGIWELLDGQREVSELAAILAAASGIEPAQAEADVLAILSSLTTEGFLAQDASS